MNFHSDLANYMERSPNSQAGCVNTGEVGPGIQFPHIETTTHDSCFIGMSSIIEGVAEAYDLTPDQVRARLSYKMDEPTKEGDDAADLRKQAHDAYEGLKRIRAAVDAEIPVHLR